MKVRYFLYGIEINEPNNHEELEIEVNYDKDGNKTSASINNWEFGVNDPKNSLDAVRLLNKQITEGLTGGVGVTEGAPFKITVDNERGTEYTIFDGYIDLWNGSVLCDKITAPAVEQGQIDWLNDVADSISYEYLYKQGAFTSDYYISVPYCKNKKYGNEIDTIVTIISLFVLTNELKRAIKDVSKDGATASNPFAFTAIIALTIEILYIAALLVAIARLIIDIYNLIVQPVKYHNAMYAKDLVEIGLTHFGLKFESSILKQPPFNKMAILPEKYNIKEGNTGFFDYVAGLLTPDKNERMGYYRGTVGELLRSLKLMFNAKIIIQDGVLYFEKQNFEIKQAKYVALDIKDVSYRFNKEDFNSNTVITFSVDYDDKNTVQKFEGTAYQIIQSPVAVTNTKMKLTKGLNQVVIPFSLAKRKTELTYAEEVLNVIFKVVGETLSILIDVVNAIISVLNDVIDFINDIIDALDWIGIEIDARIPDIPTIPDPKIQRLIESRIGMVVLESDYVSTPKVLLIPNNSNARNNTLDSNNETYLNAKYLYENYHYFNNFVTTNGWNNQMKLKSVEGVPFTFSDYEKIRLNSSIFDYDGTPAVMQSIKWNPIKQTANISYKRKEIYTTNLKIDTIYPNE